MRQAKSYQHTQNANESEAAAVEQNQALRSLYYVHYRVGECNGRQDAREPNTAALEHDCGPSQRSGESLDRTRKRNGRFDWNSCGGVPYAGLHRRYSEVILTPRAVVPPEESNWRCVLYQGEGEFISSTTHPIKKVFWRE